MHNYTFENQETENLASRKFSETHEKILEILANIFEERTKKQLQVTQKLVLDIFSLESNVKKWKFRNFYQK